MRQSNMSSDRIVLGTAKLGVNGREEAFELLDEFVRLGGRTIDTASVYSDWIPGEQGRAETVLGEWLKSRGNRNDLTIITKGAHPPLGRMHESRCDEASIRHDVEVSLTRLGIERIDQWLPHRDDPARPAAEIVGTLQALQREGKIGSFGVSNWTLARIEEARRVTDANVASSQVLGNVFCRIMNPLADQTCVVLDAPAFRDAVTQNMSLLLYTSSAHGYFERRAKGIAPTSDYANSACEAAAVKLEAIAADLGLAPANMIVAYLLYLGDIVRPVIGPRDAEQLRAMWKAADVDLPADAVRRIASAVGMSDFLG
jgi:aryl-alcohol dehydrogenase-like predicted oxidoreductase